jgi:outer membrane lipoprotein SlyB
MPVLDELAGMRERITLAVNRAKYAAMGAAVGAALGGLVSRNAASTGGGVGALVGAILGEKRVSAAALAERIRERA